MSLFGRTSCKEQRDWKVKVYVNDSGSPTVLTEQLNEKEATEFYNELKKQLEDPKEKLIEVVKDCGEDYTPVTWLISKRNITAIKLE